MAVLADGDLVLTAAVGAGREGVQERFATSREIYRRALGAGPTRRGEEVA